MKNELKAPPQILRLAKADRKPYDLLSSHARLNTKLSLSAKGLALELLGNSDEWIPHLYSMVGNSTCKKNAYRNAFMELESHGYAMSYSTTGNNRSVVWVVAEHPSLMRQYMLDNPKETILFYDVAVKRKWQKRPIGGKCKAFLFAVEPPIEECRAKVNGQQYDSAEVPF